MGGTVQNSMAGTAQNSNGMWEITDPSQKLCFRIIILNLN